MRVRQKRWQLHGPAHTALRIEQQLDLHVAKARRRHVHADALLTAHVGRRRLTQQREARGLAGAIRRPKASP